MLKTLKKVIDYIKKHKIISVVAIVLLAGAIYLGYSAIKSKIGPVSYVTVTVEKGTIITSVSGSGQVSASNQVDIKTKASGSVTYVNMAEGAHAAAGALLAQLDATDAQKAIRDAEANLQSARISLQKFIGPDPNNPTNKQDAEATLIKDYEGGYNAVANVFLDLPTIITGLDDILYGNDFNKYQQNKEYYIYSSDYEKIVKYKDSADKSYQTARFAYDKNFDDYRATSRFSDNSTVDSIINETYRTTKDIAQAIKDENNLIQFYEDTLTAKNIQPNSIADTHLASLNSYLNKVNSDLVSLLGAQSAIKNDKGAISNAGLDAQSQQLSLEKSQNALSDARGNLANYYVYAPFSGTIANVAVRRGDIVSNGTIVATIITNQSITEIPFNEVDIIKIKVGQKAILTFDAIDGLSIAGQVVEIDTLGTVMQAVVNYNVKIVFDTQNSQVKPGMSVTASIITDAKQNVLTAPNSAVKKSGNTTYVQTLVNGQPQQKTVQTGISNDTDTEIASGLNGGENVITQIITTAAKSVAPAQNNSTIRIPGVTGGGGGGGFMSH